MFIPLFHSLFHFCLPSFCQFYRWYYELCTIIMVLWIETWILFLSYLDSGGFLLKMKNRIFFCIQEVLSLTSPVSFYFKNDGLGTSLAVQWLGLCTSTAGSMGSIPGWGTKMPQAAQHSQKKKKDGLYCIS